MSCFQIVVAYNANKLINMFEFAVGATEFLQCNNLHIKKRTGGKPVLFYITKSNFSLCPCFQTGKHNQITILRDDTLR